MARKDRKVHKKRGSRTCGWGNAQKHRGAGSRGGRGMSGSKSHKWMHVSKFKPGYLGRRGFRCHAAVSGKPESINVGELESELDGWVTAGLAEKTKNQYSVNLGDLGYRKLLGAGAISRAVAVTVTSCSEKAKKKIEDAGGSLTPAEEPGEPGSIESEFEDGSGVSSPGD